VRFNAGQKYFTYWRFLVLTIRRQLAIVKSSERSKKMVFNANQIKILSAIKARGWATAECYWTDAQALKAAGLIKMGDRYFTGGNRKNVWVAA
jgi:hypothetical protein